MIETQYRNKNWEKNRPPKAEATYDPYLGVVGSTYEVVGSTYKTIGSTYGAVSSAYEAIGSICRLYTNP